MRQSITIAGVTFGTKSALKTHVRGIVVRYEDFHPLDPEDLE